MMLMGDFNIDLQKYDTNTDSTVYLDSLYTIFSPLHHNPNTGYNAIKNTH